MRKKISLLFFLFISNLFFAQTETPQIKEIKDIIAKSGEHLSKLECDKSISSNYLISSSMSSHGKYKLEAKVSRPRYL